MHLSKFLHTTSGHYLMSILLGFGLASLFRSVCKGKNCIILKAPPSSDINGEVYRFQDKCYKYNAKPTKCDANKKTVENNNA
jgi:hypothetical protein